MAPDELPRQRKGVTPQMRGRYPDFNVLDEVGHWDEATRRVVLDRIEHVPTIRFFTTDEVAALGAFLDLLLAPRAARSARSTPTPGRGTRSDSAAPPTRAATRASAWGSERAGRAKKRSRPIP